MDSRVPFGDDRGRKGLELDMGRGAAFFGVETTQYTGHVSVEGGHGNFKGDACDSSSSVFTDSGKLEQEIWVGGEFMIGKSNDGFGQGVEVTCATVVPKAFPVAKNE
jgi:hypothetical protein